MFKRRERRSSGQSRFGDGRRSAPKHAGWESRYRVVDLTREQYRYVGEDYETCLLTDISMDGAGLRVTPGDVAVGDQVELDLRLGAHRAASIQLRGEIRHAADEDDAAYAGMAFVDVGDLERALLLRLLRDLDGAQSKSA
jgi:hypothetical protein